MQTIIRRRSGKGFVYVGPSGRVIRDKKRLRRLGMVAVPPAWRRVRLAENPDARILAVGEDAKGRRQYIYNPKFRKRRESAKYEALGAFAAELPRLRARIAYDMVNADNERRRVAALCARLIDRTGIRVGSPAYRSASGTYGATTLLKRHLTLSRDRIRLGFVGKGGKAHRLALRDTRLAAGLRDLLAAPGRDLFRYRDGSGEWVTLSPTVLNAYLRERSGLEVTAKWFRTWKATTIAARELARGGPGAPLRPALDKTAAELGNTAAIVRQSYVHPAIIEAHCSGQLGEAVTGADGVSHMPAVDRAVASLVGRGGHRKACKSEK